MSFADVKTRIDAVEAQTLADAVTTSGDPIRGWWTCVGGSGQVHVDRQAGADIDAGLRRANTLADEGVAVVVVHHTHAVSDRTRALVGLLCSMDASRVTPRSESDLEWMRRCALIRDAQAELRDQLARAIDIVDAEVAATAALLLGLAARKTPVLLIGAHAHAAAVFAQRQSVAAATWWRSGFTEQDPLIARAQERLQLEPWVTIHTHLSDEIADDVLMSVIRDLQR